MPSAGLDLGGSGIRLRISSPEGRVLDETTGPSVKSANAGDPLRYAAAFLLNRCRELRISALSTVAFGLSGLHGSLPSADSALRLLHTELGARRLVLADDCVTSYVGALGDRPGVVCAAGTGVVTVASDGVGRYAKVDGWGAMAGDLGSGYWIGRAGLAAAFCAHDGRIERGSAALLAAVIERHGDPARFAHEVTTTEDAKAIVSGFAPVVLDAAAAGDVASSNIVGAAAAHLAIAIAAALDRAGAPPRIAGTGRLLTRTGVLAARLVDLLTRRMPDASWVDPAGSSLDGACRLAAPMPAPPFGTLITVTTISEVEEQ